MTSELVVNVEGRLPIGGEFQGKNGDCTEYAFMVGNTALDPAQLCNAAELNRLTQESIDAGQAAGSGAMTAANLAWLCTTEHHPYTQTTTWASVLAGMGGTLPVILQVNNGSALPGNEGGVNGHAVVALDYDAITQTLVIANGDSVNGRAGLLDTISMHDVQAASPFMVTVLQREVGSVGVPTGWRDDGHTLTAPNGHTVVLGFRDWVLTHPWMADNQPLEQEHPIPAGYTRQVFAYTELRWTPATNVYVGALGSDLIACETAPHPPPTQVTVNGHTQSTPYTFTYSIEVK